MPSAELERAITSLEIAEPLSSDERGRAYSVAVTAFRRYLQQQRLRTAATDYRTQRLETFAQEVDSSMEDSGELRLSLDTRLTALRDSVSAVLPTCTDSSILRASPTIFGGLPYRRMVDVSGHRVIFLHASYVLGAVIAVNPARLLVGEADNVLLDEAQRAWEAENGLWRLELGWESDKMSHPTIWDHLD